MFALINELLIALMGHGSNILAQNDVTAMSYSLLTIVTSTQDTISFVLINYTIVFRNSHFLRILTEMSALKVSGFGCSPGLNFGLILENGFLRM